MDHGSQDVGPWTGRLRLIEVGHLIEGGFERASATLEFRKKKTSGALELFTTRPEKHVQGRASRRDTAKYILLV